MNKLKKAWLFPPIIYSVFSDNKIVEIILPENQIKKYPFPLLPPPSQKYHYLHTIDYTICDFGVYLSDFDLK